ncbi:hypothetical protein ACH5RR_012584 [Cinchona calisaya]|uniref:Prolamin-like domain-containing protein n=1 Tax=Cinchona calisaya TaxID=153742 RepID=A0ABD3ADZ4_9GENT
MAPQSVTLFLVTIITCFVVVISFSSATWDQMPRKLSGDPSANNGSVLDCLNALTEIKSCTNEIVVFFANGKTDIGPECCKSITVITHNCWPTILTALGFTADETYVLRGYCDATSSSLSASSGPAQGPSAA